MNKMLPSTSNVVVRCRRGMKISGYNGQKGKERRNGEGSNVSTHIQRPIIIKDLTAEYTLLRCIPFLDSHSVQVAVIR
jgi:hypothetical protein